MFLTLKTNCKLYFNESPVHVRCTILNAWGWCTGMTQRDGMGREIERLLLNHANTPGFLAPGGEEFNPGPETRLDCSELLCNKVLLKYKGDRESF